MKISIELNFPDEMSEDEKNDVLTNIINNMPDGVGIQAKDNIFDLIRTWAEKKGIYTSGDPKTQTLKLAEEMGELAKGILNSDTAEIQDAIGDCAVVLVSVAKLCNLKFETCIESAYQIIKSRNGKMENGTFIKNS